MGTGNKLDPTKFEITDIYKTSVCPLAKVMRKELKNRNIQNIKAVWSSENPHSSFKSDTPGSTAFCPPAAGLILASEIINDLVKRFYDSSNS